MIKPLDKGFVWFFRGDYLYVRKNGKDIANLTCRDKAKDNIKIGYLRKLGIEIEED